SLRFLAKLSGTNQELFEHGLAAISLDANDNVRFVPKYGRRSYVDAVEFEQTDRYRHQLAHRRRSSLGQLSAGLQRRLCVRLFGRLEAFITARDSSRGRRAGPISPAGSRRASVLWPPAAISAFSTPAGTNCTMRCLFAGSWDRSPPRAARRSAARRGSRWRRPTNVRLPCPLH